MNNLIPDDAKELAYYRSYREVPTIVQVSGMTPTTVKIVDSNYPFYKKDGRRKGGYSSGSHVAPVTPAVRDHIAAAEKLTLIRSLNIQVRSAASRKLENQLKAAYAVGYEEKARAADTTIESLRSLLAWFGGTEAP